MLFRSCPLSGKFSEEDLLTELLKLDKFYRQPQSSPFAVNGQFLSVLEKLYQTSHKVTGESVLAEEIAEYLRVQVLQLVNTKLLNYVTATRTVLAARVF